MNYLSAIFLGILQGLTEFLPVSSSGHLVIAQRLTPNFTQPGVLFDVILHSGTLFAVLIYFRKSLFKITKRYIFLLIIGTIPAVVIGLLFQNFLEDLFNNILIVGFALLLTGLINYYTDKNITSKKKLSSKDAILVGLSQALAIIPGISRSGSTIFTASKLGIKKVEAAKFSFLLSVPAVAGASLLELITHFETNTIQFGVYFAGFVAALLSGYLAIGLVFQLLAKAKFKYFGFYCILLGLTVLLMH